MRTQGIKGAVLVTVAMALFVQNDVATKLLTERFATPQVMILRGIVGCIVLLVALRMTGARYSWRQALHPSLLARSTCDAGASLAFVFALPHIPLATITAVTMLSPVVSAAAGAVLFRETINARLVFSMALGFAGVLIFARPEAGGVDRPLMLAVLATLLLSLRDLITRKTEADVPSGLVALVTTLAVPVLLMPAVVHDGFEPMPPLDVMLLVYAGVFAAVGNWLLVAAVRLATLAEIAPFRYAAIPISMLASLVVWGENPNGGMIAGSLLIAAGGILALSRLRSDDE